MTKADKKTHLLRPGVLRGTQILCEDPEAAGRGDWVAECSDRGAAQVTCQDCKVVGRDLMIILPLMQL